MSKTTRRTEYGAIRNSIRAAIAARAPGEPFGVADIAAALDGRLPTSRVGITIAELVRRGEVTRVAPGVFVRGGTSMMTRPEPVDRSTEAEPLVTGEMRVVGMLDDLVLCRRTIDDGLWIARRLTVRDI